MSEVGQGKRPSRRWAVIAQRALGTLVVLGLFLWLYHVGPGYAVGQLTGFSHQASVALVIVIIAALLWVTELVPLFVTSFIILALELIWLLPTLQAAQIKSDAADFLAPFISNVVLLFLGGFTLGRGLQRFQLDRAMASFVLARAGSKPPYVLAALLLTSAFLSMWMSNTATTAMMLGLTMPLVEQLEESDPFRRALPLSVALGANLGGLGTPVGTPPNAIVVDALAREGIPISFATWMGMTLPFLLLFLASAWFVLLKLFPPQAIKIELRTTTKIQWTRPAVVVVLTTIITALLWLAGGYLGLAIGTVALLPVVVFFGLGYLTQGDFRNLPWDVLFLAGGGLSLGAAVEKSGLAEASVAAISSAGLAGASLALAVVLLAGLMTTFMSNTATANLLVPVALGLSGVNTQELMVLVAYACSTTMLLPVSTPPNAMVFSSGMIRTSDLMRPALWLGVIAIVASLFLGPLWWGLFLGSDGL